ncbi:MAG: 1,4-dihydroxy-2-naphthoate polyprenyltransferase [Hyphomicrobiales bacterium]
MEVAAQTGAARPTKARAWLHAARIPTLAAAVVPVAVGTAVAVRHGVFRAGPALAALAGALLIQIGTNLANDLFDYRKGADAAHRLGPPRVIVVGWLSASEVRTGMLLCFAIAALAGVYLTAVAGWPVVAIGVASIAAGIGYTAGRWALAYNALGDVAVFLFFGLVAVGGTYYVQAGRLDPLALFAAVPVGALCTAILVVNNVRDLDTDRAAGKRTLSVVLGRSGTRAEFGALLVVAFSVVIGLWMRGRLSIGALLPLATLTFAIRTYRVVATREDGPSLNRALFDTARLHVFFGLLFAAGILIP